MDENTKTKIILLYTTLALTNPTSMASVTIDFAWWCAKKSYNLVYWITYGSEKTQEEKLLVATNAQVVQLQDNIAELMREVKRLETAVKESQPKNENLR